MENLPGSSLFDNFGVDTAVPGEPNFLQRLGGLGKKVAAKLQSDPALRQSFLDFGAQVSQPIQPGQSGFSQFTSALAGSIGSLQKQRAATASQAKKDDFTQQGLDVRKSAVDATNNSSDARTKVAIAKAKLSAAKTARDQGVKAQKWEEDQIRKLTELGLGDEEQAKQVAEIKAARVRIYGEAAGDETPTLPPAPTQEDVISQAFSDNPDLVQGTPEAAQLFAGLRELGADISLSDFNNRLQPQVTENRPDTIALTADKVFGDLFPDVPPPSGMSEVDIADNAPKLMEIFQQFQGMAGALRGGGISPEENRQLSDLQSASVQLQRLLKSVGVNVFNGN